MRLKTACYVKGEAAQIFIGFPKLLCPRAHGFSEASHHSRLCQAFLCKRAPKQRRPTTTAAQHSRRSGTATESKNEWKQQRVQTSQTRLAMWGHTAWFLNVPASVSALLQRLGAKQLHKHSFQCHYQHFCKVGNMQLSYPKNIFEREKHSWITTKKM